MTFKNLLKEIYTKIFIDYMMTEMCFKIGGESGWGDKRNKTGHELDNCWSWVMVTGGSLHSALYFCIFLFFLTTKSWKTKATATKFWELKTLVQFSDLTDGDSGHRDIILKSIPWRWCLPLPEFLPPTESIKLTCVKLEWWCGCYPLGA